MNTIILTALLMLPILAFSEEATPVQAGTPVANTPRAFGPGEILDYKLVWNGITAGTLTIKTFPKVDLNNEKTWKFQLNAKTSGLADKIYTVRLNIISHLSEDLSCSRQYFADKVEGSRTKIQKFTYDWDTMRVQYQKNRTIDRGKRILKAKSYDPLGMFYAIRNMTINDDTKELDVWVSDGKDNVFSKAYIVSKETIEVNDKTYQTYLVEPELKDLKGVFSKSKDAKLQLWLSADIYHIPVKIKSKVAVGSFTAELVNHTKATTGVP